MYKNVQVLRSHIMKVRRNPIFGFLGLDRIRKTTVDKILLLILLFALVACSNPDTTNPRELTANNNGVELYIRVAGDPASGNVLIAIHGGPGMTHDYMLGLEQLAGPNLAVVTYDQRGIGLSSSPPADPANYTLAKYAEDLDAVRQVIGAESIHLFGHSWGGIVAQSYATLYPERVRSIVLMGSGPPTREQTLQCQDALVQRMIALIRQGIISENPEPGSKEAERGYLPAYFSDPDFWFSPDDLGNAPIIDERTNQINDLTWAANESYDLTADLAGLEVRVLNLFGEDDPVRQVASPAIIAALPNATVESVVLSRCGHFWQECPDEFYPRLQEFLGITESSSNPFRLNPILAQSESVQSCSTKPIPGCSVFTVSKGEQVFFGGNDDYINPDSYYWVDPGNGKDYGAIWIGTPDNVQQGVNEKGLAYDANGLPRVDTNPHPEREPVSGGYGDYPIQILHECATVEEVLKWVSTHQWHSYMHDQMQFADATGDAVIISAGADGEIVFTRKPPGDSFLVSTNFNVANPSNGNYPCQRYETATEMLGQLVNQGCELSAQDAVNVLDAVHEDGAKASWTIESLVADLPNGIVYLYYFHQYDQPVVLNVAEEIVSGRVGGPLSKLFPEEVQQEAARRYQRIQEQRSRYETLGKVWLGLVVASLFILLIGSIKGPKGLIFWIPVVIILGPVGLLIWLATRRNRGTGRWQTILVEVAGDVIPTVVAFVAVAVGLVLRMGASELVTLALFFGSPFIIGWLIFQGPLLAFATHKGYWRTLFLRLPHTWVVANLGIAAIFPIATPLVNMSIQLPLRPWTAVFWWGITVMSTLAAMLLLLLYETWAIRRGYRGWTILAWREGEVTSAPWKKTWWWIPLSYAVLFVGLIGYVIIQQMLVN